MGKFDLTKISKSTRKIADTLRKHAPEILATAGTLGVAGGFITGCIQAVKTDKKLTDGKAKIDEIKATVENPETAKKEIKAVKKEVAIGVVKDMVLPVTLVTGGTISLLSSVGILKKRTATLSTAYTALSTAFTNYRNRVVDKFGEKVDKELRFGGKEETIAEEVTDENGNTKLTTTTGKVLSEAEQDAIRNSYVIRFDRRSKYWNKHSMDLNICHAKSVQAWANTQLQIHGRVTVAEYAREFGVEPNEYMLIAGHIDDDSLDMYARENQVDFRIRGNDPYDCVYHDPGTHEPYILIDPNVDGSVFDWYSIPREYVKFRRKGNKAIGDQFKDCKAAFLYGEYGETTREEE